MVHDVVSEGGKPVEITEDWYAQDSEGNVWYFGENTAEIHNGKRDTSGSFEAGVERRRRRDRDARPPDAGSDLPGGVLRRATPRTAAGCSPWTSRPRSPSATSRNVILTEDYTPVEPNVLELKFYAPGIGQVLAQTVSGGSEREELISFTK